MEWKPFALIGALGDGLGTALCEELIAHNYEVIGLARTDTLRERFADEMAQQSLHLVACDLFSPSSMDRAFLQVSSIIEQRQGRLDTYIHNGSQLVRGTVLETDHQDFENVWRLSAFSAFYLSQKVLPLMLKNQTGHLIFTGATASLKGQAQFSALASAKFALRGLAQSLAREYGPKGIHVVHTVLDGIIDCEWTRDLFSMEKEHTMQPQDLAKVYLQLMQQPPSTWTQELDLRPYCEPY